MTTALTESPPIVAMINSPDMQRQVALALPKTLTKERFLRMMLTAFRQTPKLLTCSQSSVLAGMFELAQMGLEPSTPLGHAWLIPYSSQAQVVIGYKGFIALAERAGVLMNAEVVYEGDQFDYALGSDPFIKHVPCDDIKARGELKWAYSVAQLSDGRSTFKLINRADIDEAKLRSQAYQAGQRNKQKRDSPWYTDKSAMWRKTAIRRHAPFLPLSTEFTRAVQLDGQWEAGVAQQLVLPVGLGAVADSPDELEATVRENAPTAEEQAKIKAAEAAESGQGELPTTGAERKGHSV